MPKTTKNGTRVKIIHALRFFLLFSLLSFPSIALSLESPTKKDPSDPAPPTALIEAIIQRNIELDEKAEKLKKREEQLHALEQEIETTLKKLSKIVQDIRNDRKERKDAEDQQFKKLAKVYEAMAPEDAAPRIEHMKESLALNILNRMKAKPTAQILSGMSPSKAARFSEQLTQSNHSSP